MVGALILIMVGIPITLWCANGFNGFLSGAPTWSQVENTNAFYEGPIVDGVSTEARVATQNGTVVTAETPTWDASGEWDVLVLTANGTNSNVIFNWNMSLEDLLNSKISAFRIMVNTSKELVVSWYAVKWDTATLTKSLAYTHPHVGEDNSTIYWNITASDLLALKKALNPSATDTVWMQIVITGYGNDNLYLADTLTFQLAYSEPSNAYSFSHYQILRFTAFLIGSCLFFVGFASTPYFNPLGFPKSSGSSRGTKRKRTRRSSKRRRTK